MTKDQFNVAREISSRIEHLDNLIGFLNECKRDSDDLTSDYRIRTHDDPGYCLRWTEINCIIEAFELEKEELEAEFAGL